MSNNSLGFALSYVVRYGWRIFPVPPGSKLDIHRVDETLKDGFPEIARRKIDEARQSVAIQ